MEYLWAEGWVLEHDRRVAEFLDETIPALDSSVRDLSDLVTAVCVPARC
jgi:hypothetical protein